MRYIISFFFILGMIPANAQIIPDSAVEEFGNLSTRYFLEKDVYFNRETIYRPDTSLDQQFNYNKTIQGLDRYQNLGLFLTPLNSIYKEAPRTVGTDLGPDHLRQYYYDPTENQYFNTGSPYSKIQYDNGAESQLRLSGDVTRNVFPFWNLGLRYTRAASEKKLGNPRSDEVQVDHHSVIAYTSFFDPTGHYTLLANYSFSFHDMQELGGIYADPDDNIDSLYDYEVENVLLNNVISKEKINRWHIYQEYDFFKDNRIQIFHQYQRQVQKNTYDDFDLFDTIPGLDYSNFGFYTFQNFDSNDSSVYRFNIGYRKEQHKIGIKSRMGPLFVSAYFKNRDLFYYRSQNFQTDFLNERFAGADISYFKNDTSKMSATLRLEGLLGDDNKIQGRFRYDALDLNLLILSKSPRFQQQVFKTSGYSWENRFDNPVYTQLSAKYSKKLFHKLQLSPEARFLSVSNLIYFNEQARPEQATVAPSVMDFGLTSHYTQGKFSIDLYYRYAIATGVWEERIPENQIRALLYYDNKIFDDKAYVHVGFQYSYMSQFFGDAYMPAVFSYHFQNDFPLFNYHLLDFFFAMQLKKANVYLKVFNLTQGLGQRGYFVAPFFTAPPLGVEFGIKWFFYN